MSSVGSSMVRGGSALGLPKFADRVADLGIVEADDRAHVAGADLVHFLLGQAVELQHLHDGVVERGAICLPDHGHFLVLPDLAGEHAADDDLADELAVLKRGDLHLERRVLVHVRGGHVVEDRVEQRLQILRRRRRDRWWRCRCGRWRR